MAIANKLKFPCNQIGKTAPIVNEEKEGLRKIIVKYKYNLSKEMDLNGRKVFWFDRSETEKKSSKTSKSCQDSGCSTELQGFNNNCYSNNWKSKTECNRDSRLPKDTSTIKFEPIKHCSFSQYSSLSSDEELQPMSVKELIKIFEASCSGSEEINELETKPSLRSSLSKSHSCNCSYKVVSSPYNNKWSSIEVLKRHKKQLESKKLPQGIIIKYKYFLSTNKDANDDATKWNPAMKTFKPNQLNKSEAIAKSTIQKLEGMNKGRSQALEAAPNLLKTTFNKFDDDVLYKAEETSQTLPVASNASSTHNMNQSNMSLEVEEILKDSLEENYGIKISNKDACFVKNEDVDGNAITWNPAVKTFEGSQLNRNEGIAKANIQKPEIKKRRSQACEAALNSTNTPLNKEVEETSQTLSVANNESFGFHMNHTDGPKLEDIIKDAVKDKDEVETSSGDPGVHGSLCDSTSSGYNSHDCFTTFEGITIIAYESERDVSSNEKKTSRKKSKTNRVTIQQTNKKERKINSNAHKTAEKVKFQAKCGILPYNAVFRLDDDIKSLKKFVYVISGLPPDRQKYFSQEEKKKSKNEKITLRSLGFQPGDVVSLEVRESS